MDVSEMGKRIQQVREERGYSLDYIASEIGVAKSTIQRYEKGLIATPKIPVVHAIANTLGVNPSWLIGKSDEKYMVEQEGTQPYYLDPEAAAVAQEVFSNPDLKILFDAARDVSPESLRLAAEMLRRMKDTNPDG